MPSTLAPDFAIVTPSYAVDEVRCRLLSESLGRFARFDYRHYIIVPPPDLDRFGDMADRRTRIVSTEELFARRLEPPHEAADYWRMPDGRPVHGWIVQQLAKIAFAQQARERTLLYVDSDTLFIRPFDRRLFERSGRPVLFRVASQYIRSFERWYAQADALLGVDGYVPGTNQPNYIVVPVVWDASTVRAMCRRIEAVSLEPWFERLIRLETFSEYTLYGVFVEKCLRGSAAVVPVDALRCHGHWKPDRMDESQLRAFLDRIDPGLITVMLSAKARIDPQRYRHVMDRQAIPE